MSARRAAGVRDPLHAIEHQAARAFEKHAPVLEGCEIDDALEPIAVPLAQRVE